MFKVLTCNDQYVFVECNMCHGILIHPNGCIQCYGMGFAKIAIDDVIKYEFCRPR